MLFSRVGEIYYHQRNQKRSRKRRKKGWGRWREGGVGEMEGGRWEGREVGGREVGGRWVGGGWEVGGQLWDTFIAEH